VTAMSPNARTKHGMMPAHASGADPGVELQESRLADEAQVPQTGSRRLNRAL